MAEFSTTSCTRNAHGTNYNNAWKGNCRASARKRPPSPQKYPQNQQRYPQSQRNCRTLNVTGRGSENKSKRPAYLRLDSTGENSTGSSEESSNGWQCSSPRAQPNPCSEKRPRFPRDTQSQAPKQRTDQQGAGLFDRMRSAFAGPPSISYRNQGIVSQNFMYQSKQSSDTTLANLDLVAEKFTNMSCHMMDGTSHRTPPQAQPWQTNGARWCGPMPTGTQGQGAGLLTRERNPPQFFHPYFGSNQSNFAQNYRRTYQQPWQQMMGRNQPFFHQSFHGGFDHFPRPRPPRWQMHQYPQSPWQQPWWNPQGGMMQGHCNTGAMNPQRNWSPCKNQTQKTNYRRGKRNSSSPQSKSYSSDGSKENSKANDAHQIKASSNGDHTAAASICHEPLNVCSKETPSCLPEEGSREPTHEETVDKSAIVDQTAAPPASIAKDDDEQSENTCRNLDHCSIGVCQIDDDVSTIEMIQPEVKLEDTACDLMIQRHSSIEIILADYESQSSVHVSDKTLSTDSDFSDADGESATDANSDLWESFTTSDDPYNPLCGWRYRQEIDSQVATSLPNQSLEYSHDYHIDSGTDEGDGWSETDDDDSEADDEEDVVDRDPVPSFNQSESFELTIPQLQKLQGNLSSTPKMRTDKSSAIHHPTVAFILRSTSSSSDDEDSDEDWDTVDSSGLQDNSLWDSLNKARDPYSPLNAWKCNASSFYSAEESLSSPRSDGPSVRTCSVSDSVEKLKVDKSLPNVNNERKFSDKCERSTSKDSLSDGETFAILAVHVHGAKDDTDGAMGSPQPLDAMIRRVASASCLRKVHRTPELKSLQKVRFCPRSSFIVLVEKDLPSSDSNPCLSAGTDWLACARDRMRFQNRIDQAAEVLDPILSHTHRERVYQSRLSSDGSR